MLLLVGQGKNPKQFYILLGESNMCEALKLDR